jgi:hypothetical protein
MGERAMVAVEAISLYRVRPPQEPAAVIADAGRHSFEGNHAAMIGACVSGLAIGLQGGDSSTTRLPVQYPEAFCTPVRGPIPETAGRPKMANWFSASVSIAVVLPR